eukprot:g6703.t1
MGIRWRRINERLKQRLNLSKSNFLATSNRRCERMFEEASQFAIYLRRLESRLKKLQDDSEEMMSETRSIMLSSLPCTFDFTPTGQAVANDPDPQRIGQNVKLDLFTSAMQIIRQKLDEEVVDPLRSWLEAFEKAEERLKILEDIRLELDSRRRTVEYLQDRVEKQKALLDSGALRSSSSHELSLKQLQHKEEKKNSTLSTFKDEESQVYQILYELNKDTACLRDYTAMAYSIITESFYTAQSAFVNTGLAPRLEASSPGTPSVLANHNRGFSSGNTDMRRSVFIRHATWDNSYEIKNFPNHNLGFGYRSTWHCCRRQETLNMVCCSVHSSTPPSSLSSSIATLKEE